MKVYIDINKMNFIKLESKAFYQGSNSDDKIRLFFNEKPTNWAPTLTYLLPNGRKIGPISSVGLLIDESRQVEVDGATFYYFDFMLSQRLGTLNVPGVLQATITLNYFNEKGNTINRNILGNLIIQVIKTAFNDNNILILGDEVEGVVVDFSERIEAIDNRITIVEDGVKEAINNNLDVPIKNDEIYNICN